MEHRFRALKCQADFLRALVKKGVDPEPYKVYEIKNKEGKTSRRFQPAARLTVVGCLCWLLGNRV